MLDKVLGKSWSVCPICLNKVMASLVQEGEDVFQQKVCPTHGTFKTLVWEGSPELEQWCGLEAFSSDMEAERFQEDREGCPYTCGICESHQQKSCCVLLEVTQRCNLECPVCFANAGAVDKVDPTLEQIRSWYEMLMEKGGPFNIQLSGGEPTLRDDLPEIITMGKQMGFDFFQLNTNGIRLGEDLSYCQKLSEAGLNCAFLQFDTLKPEVYEVIRGANLRKIKELAIENCKTCGIGVVLVPTVVMGQNDGELGDLIRYAKSRMPDVRGIHFQPISYFGRYPDALQAQRLTLPKLMRLVAFQMEGEIKVSDFIKPNSEHPMCSFNSKFGLNDQNALTVISGQKSRGCCSVSESERPVEIIQFGNPADQARKFVAKQWSAVDLLPMKDQPMDSLDLFLQKSKYTLTVSAMVFQDAWNLDLNRLKRCHIHVVSPSGNLVPFCAYNLTDAGGNTLYR